MHLQTADQIGIMDISTGIIEPATPAPSHDLSLWRNEDSGYHTSFTPGSVERSGVPSSILDITNTDTTPEPNFHIGRKSRLKNNLSTHYESPECSPTKRRGYKRRFHDVGDENTVPTPTTLIAGGIRNLNVNDTNSNFCSPSKNPRYEEMSNNNIGSTFPSTPIKKICRNSCKHNPLQESSNYNNFTIHSLRCSVNGIKEVQNAPSVDVKSLIFSPIPPITDLIHKLYDRNQEPPLKKIFSYLSDEDICTFNLVSPTWNLIWVDIGSMKDQDRHASYLKNLKENQENKEIVPPVQINVIRCEPKSSNNQQMRSLKELHHVLNAGYPTVTAPRSPPATPRAIKFRKFAKVPSQDKRKQVRCPRCSHPAKVTKTADEEWAECTSSTCAVIQFCRDCNCERHPGTNCKLYGFEKASPMRRKKTSHGACTQLSKKALKRLKF